MKQAQHRRPRSSKAPLLDLDGWQIGDFGTFGEIKADKREP